VTVGAIGDGESLSHIVSQGFNSFIALRGRYAS
jgi:hypothetical protein